MNSLSALEMKLDIQTKSIAQKLFVREISGQVDAQPIKATIHNGNLASSNAPDYRLGEPVYHGRYGVGQVMAHLPDGRLQIRFDGVRKSRMIFPSLINRI
jgi:hypothetical protein